MPGDITPGYAYCRHLIAFFTSAKYWLLEPSDHLVTANTTTSTAYALANPDGTELLVYLATATAFQLQLPGGQSALWEGHWFDPRTGQRQPLANVTAANHVGGGDNGAGYTVLQPPSMYSCKPRTMCVQGDVALRLTVAEGSVGTTHR